MNEKTVHSHQQMFSTSQMMQREEEKTIFKTRTHTHRLIYQLAHVCILHAGKKNSQFSTTLLKIVHRLNLVRQTITNSNLVYQLIFFNKFAIRITNRAKKWEIKMLEIAFIHIARQVNTFFERYHPFRGFTIASHECFQSLPPKRLFIEFSNSHLLRGEMAIFVRLRRKKK